MSGSGILSFIDKGSSMSQNRGIRTFPDQTYGVSRESPDQFKKKHTMISKNGYLYQHQNAPQFEYCSQKRSKNVLELTLEQKNECRIDEGNKNPLKYHLKKGRLGDFLDKNGWMNTIYIMNGHERTKEGRQLNNFDRTMRIKSRKKPIEYDSKLTYKPKSINTISFTPQELMSEKVRIRSRRNQQAIRQIPVSQKKISNISVSDLEINDIKMKMNQTTKSWYKSLKKDKIGKDSTISHRLSRFNQDGIKEGQLEEWQRKTCKAKWYSRQKEDPEKHEIFQG